MDSDVAGLAKAGLTLGCVVITFDVVDEVALDIVDAAVDEHPDVAPAISPLSRRRTSSATPPLRPPADTCTLTTDTSHQPQSRRT